jgi:transketolase
MRKQLCDALVDRARNPDMVFLTGDLGFMALEPLQQTLGERFINAGVAEQNMVSVSAALARQGLDAWVYSIAPFCYARPFEQIRNDITFHALPVKLIGNGGGYGYGVMGPTHHAIEDYGVLLTLPNIKAYIPVFDNDVGEVVSQAGASPLASYLRLGRGEQPADYGVPAYAPWRCLLRGEGIPVIAVGPLAGTYIDACRAMPESERPTLWAVSELPLALNPPPAELLAHIARLGRVCLAEEHVERGGFAAEFALFMLRNGLSARVASLSARAHRYARYGSQGYLRKESGLDPANLLDTLDALSRA